MGIQRVHQTGSIALNITTPVPVTGITNMVIRTGTETIRDQAGGSIYVTQSQISNQRPGITFTTTQIHEAITAFGLSGYCLDGTDAKTVRAYVLKRDCDGYTSGSTHNMYDIADGIVVPRSLRIDHNGNAEISYEVVAKYDGTNDPLLVKDGAVPTGGTPDDKWTLGQFQVASNILSGKRSVEIDFGASLMQLGSDSESFDSFVGMSQLAPTITITFIDVNVFNDPNNLDSGTVPLAGLIGEHADTDLYLAKKRVAGGTPSHIRLTASGLAYVDQVAGGDSSSEMTSTLMIECDDDGTNPPINWDLAVTLP